MPNSAYSPWLQKVIDAGPVLAFVCALFGGWFMVVFNDAVADVVMEELKEKEIPTNKDLTDIKLSIQAVELATENNKATFEKAYERIEGRQESIELKIDSLIDLQMDILRDE